MSMITSMPLRLYLIRHGETEWSLSGQHTGLTDIPLTAHGEDAARELGQRLRETPTQISTRADRFIARLRVLDGNVALFSQGHFGRVLAARWIGVSVEQAQHFLLSTASLSVLCYEHDRTDQPAIALWNSASHETFDPVPSQGAGDTRPMKQRAIERWENEGGEIRNEQRNQTGSSLEGA